MIDEKSSTTQTLNVQLYIITLFISTIMFFRKWVIFQKVFSIKQSHFPMFGNNLKWVQKQSPNIFYLAYCEIESFSKKI